MRQRAMVYERVGSFGGRHVVPHITLFFADLPAECVRYLCDGITSGVVRHKGFTLHYDGVTYFPDKRTIYIDPVEKDAIASVRRSIVQGVRAYPQLSDAVRETEHPHLTIAAGLKPAQFEGAWQVLAPHECRMEEQVTELVLLRRDLLPRAEYEHVRTFALG